MPIRLRKLIGAVALIALVVTWALVAMALQMPIASVRSRGSANRLQMRASVDGMMERGFGHTLGNAMRRMLLSSLRGSAVWGIRIDGVLHEHQTIPGVVEDVHQIIGNLKSLVLTLPDDVDEAVLRIQKSEAGPVTAGDVDGRPQLDAHVGEAY